jgi:hypothetical protein
MRAKLLAILAINLFLLVTVLSVAPTRGQSVGQWITNYTIADLRTGQILRQTNSQTAQNVSNGAILAGADLNVTITIQVTTSSPNTNLQITTSLGHSSIQGTYWELQSKGYAGISGATYNPNQQIVTFNQITGTLVISCYGTIAPGLTQTQIGAGISLDRKASSALIILSDPSSNQLDKIQVDVIDATIDNYDTLLAAALNEVQTLKNNGADPAYITLYQSVITSAQNQANQGFASNAIDTLTQLSSAQSAGGPVSTTPIMATLFLPTVVALAVILVIIAFLFVRTRGKVNYSKLVIEDQIKDLEGLTLRASKVDKNISSSLESVKDRLKSLVGAE